MQPTQAPPISSLEAIKLSEELNFQKYWSVLKRRSSAIALVSGSIFGLTAYATLQQPSVYQASGKILFKPDGSQNLVGIKNDSGVLQALTQKSDPLSTQAEIIQSEPVVKATVKALNLRDAEGNLLDHRFLSAGITVKPVVGTDIVQIAYSSTDPQIAAAVVNELMKAYITKNVEGVRKDALSARKFILEQLPETEKAVNQAEANLRQFKEANGVVSLEQEAIASVQSLTVLDQQITQAQAELRQATARVAELRSQVGMDTSTALTISSLNQSEGVQKALSEWQQAQALLAKQQTLYRGTHPSVAQFQRQEEAARAQVQERVAEVLGNQVQLSTGQLQIGTTKQALVGELAKAEVDQLSLNQKLDSLGASQEAFADRSSTLPALEQSQRSLQRQLDAAQTTYKTLLARLQEVQIAANQKVGNAEVVTPADVPLAPAGPRVMLNLLAGGIAGLLLGVAAAFLLDYRDRSVRTMQEARALFNYTLLGVIPTIDLSLLPGEQGIPKVLTHESASFAAQEAYQMLQANLRFSSPTPPKSIVVTSCVGQEGKSTIAANLAAAMSQVKQRVLLVDANLRMPCQHHVWELSNLIGLSNVIVSQVELEQAIHEITPNLHVLTAGVIPPNPMALIDSSQMTELIQQFTTTYDFVVFDAPSLSGSVDTTVLNKMTDGTLLVVRPKTIDAGTGKSVKEYLSQSGQTVLGMVINHFDAQQELDSYFYHNEKEISRLPMEQDRIEI
jgi:polysaccharide biosynthesis transport protein